MIDLIKKHLGINTPDWIIRNVTNLIDEIESSKWKTGYPDLIKGKHFSDNVIAEVEGYSDPQVMCVFELSDGGEKHIVWANCNGDIYGEGEFDDNYSVIRWTEIPTPPTK